MTIAHSRPHQRAMYLVWFVVLLGLVFLTDWLRWDESFTGPMRHYFWLMLSLPVTYLASTLLLPLLVSRCNAEKKVPMRVTG